MILFSVNFGWSAPPSISRAESNWAFGAGPGRLRRSICPGRTRPVRFGYDESNGSTSTVDVFSALITDWNQAVVANDPDAIAAFAEPDWVFVGENGIFPG